MDNNKIIYCLGDSHAGFFAGQNSTRPASPESSRNLPFRSYRLGAVLAYRLCDFNTTMRGKENFLKLLEEIPKGSNLLLCFGEIDCRVHLIKQAQTQNRGLPDVVAECVKRYFSFIAEIKNDYRVIVWGVIPSTPSEEVLDPRYPHFGSCLERNQATMIFNDNLKRLAQENGVRVISIFDQLIKEDGRTNDKFYIDKVHLSQRAMPLAIRQFQTDFPDLGVRFFSNKFLLRLPVKWQFQLFTTKCYAQTMLYFFLRWSKQIIKKIVISIIGEGAWLKIRRLIVGRC